jgi:hypothetical protein
MTAIGMPEMPVSFSNHGKRICSSISDYAADG